MFSDFFVRINTGLLFKESKFLLKNHFNPELYLTGIDLKGVEAQGLGELATRIGDFQRNTLHAPFFDISPGGFDQEIRDLSFRKLDMVMEIAEKFNSELVVVHFNYYEVYYKENFNRWLENTANFFIKLLAKHPEPYIALENIGEENPTVVLELTQRINHQKIIHCFDIGHFNVFSQISQAQWLNALAPAEKIHFHFHDNHGDYDSHLPIGKGNINWYQLKDTILKNFSNFTVTLECHNKSDLIKSVENYQKIFLK